VNGKPLRDIEILLGGAPDAPSLTKKTCPRARELVGTIVQRGISFAIGLIAHVIEDIEPFEQQDTLDRSLIECLGTLVRKGLNEVDMLFFASERKTLLGRVQIHSAWRSRAADAFNSDS
jgi:hypothetical protein